MNLVSTPLRISFVGGGTDFKAWFDKGKKFEKIRNIPEEDGLWDLKAWCAHINSLCTRVYF